MDTGKGYIRFRVYYDVRMVTLIHEKWRDTSSDTRSVVVSKLYKRN